MEDDDKVIDSRSSDAGRTIRRRRECLACERRFTTYEKTNDGFKLSVIKRDESRVPYERDKIIGGLEKACYKRPVPAAYIQKIADKAEENLFKRFDKEVPSTEIGEQVMRYLRAVDKIAYIRFASIYREFTDIGALKEVVDTLALDKSFPSVEEQSPQPLSSNTSPFPPVTGET